MHLRAPSSFEAPVAEPNFDEAGGRHCRLGELAQLRLVLPFTLPPPIVTLWQAYPLLGAGVRMEFPSSACLLRLLSLERIIDEVLHHEPAGSLSAHGWLPIAACGQRGVSLYFVDTTCAELPLWRVTEGKREALDVGLLRAIRSATPAPDARARRRLHPTPPATTAVGAPGKRKPQPHSASGPRAKRRQVMLDPQRCPHTLPLFS